MEGLDDCERAPSGGSAKAGAAATGGLDDGEPWDASDDFDRNAAAPDDSHAAAPDDESLFAVLFYNTVSEWIQSGLFKILLYDGMFGKVIAATGMNLLYDFNCVTHDFLGQHAFEGSHSNLIRGTLSCTKPSYC